MAKENYYPIMLGVKISEDQENKILTSGMSKSEFVREAIDFYSEARLNSYTVLKCNVIDECIRKLNVFRQNVKNSDVETFNNMVKNVKSVKQGEGETLNKTYESFNKNEENVLPEKNVKQKKLNKTSQNVKQDLLYEPIKAIEDTLIRLIVTKGHLSDSDYSFQASRAKIKPAELKKYMFENSEYFENKVEEYREKQV